MVVVAAVVAATVVVVVAVLGVAAVVANGPLVAVSVQKTRTRRRSCRATISCDKLLVMLSGTHFTQLLDTLQKTFSRI